MQKAELLALAERVEALEGRDMHVDRMVRDALGQPNDYAADWGARGKESPAAFRYTASIDDVLTLANTDAESTGAMLGGIDALEDSGWPKGEWAKCLPRYVLAAILRAKAGGL